MGTGNRSLLCYDYIIQHFEPLQEGFVKQIGQTQHKLNFTSWNLTPAAAGGGGRQICNGFFENSSYSLSLVCVSLLESWTTVWSLSR